MIASLAVQVDSNSTSIKKLDKDSRLFDLFDRRIHKLNEKYQVLEESIRYQNDETSEQIELVADDAQKLFSSISQNIDAITSNIHKEKEIQNLRHKEMKLQVELLTKQQQKLVNEFNNKFIERSEMETRIASVSREIENTAENFAKSEELNTLKFNEISDSFTQVKSLMESLQKIQDFSFQKQKQLEKEQAQSFKLIKQLHKNQRQMQKREALLESKFEQLKGEFQQKIEATREQITSELYEKNTRVKELLIEIRVKEQLLKLREEALNERARDAIDRQLAELDSGKNKASSLSQIPSPSVTLSPINRSSSSSSSSFLDSQSSITLRLTPRKVTSPLRSASLTRLSDSSTKFFSSSDLLKSSFSSSSVTTASSPLRKYANQYLNSLYSTSTLDSSTL